LLHHPHVPARSQEDLIRWLLSRRTGETGLDCLQRIQPYLARMNVLVELGTSEAKRWLDLRGGEAVTEAFEGGPVILFRDAAPSRSAVLEELAHLAQHMAEHFVEHDALEMGCRREIEAKACLVDNRERLVISDSEDAATRQQLETERAMLRQLENRFR
jgi:hypothetical protein